MIIVELIYNLSVLVAVSIISGFVDFRFSRDEILGQILQGVLFGIVCVIGMTYPFVLTEGIIFDGRSIIISLGTLFFGPITGVISALIAIGYRLSLGGGGWLMGVLVITASYLIGVYFHLRKKKSTKQLSKLDLYFFGLLVHIMMMILVLALPSKSILHAYKIISLTVLGVYPIITLIIGKIFLDQELKLNLLKELSENESLYRTTLYSIGDAVITTDANGIIRNMNSVAENLTGFKENESRGKSLTEIFKIINEETRVEVENPVEKVLSQNRVVSLANHTILINKHGVEIPIADSGAPIRDEDNNIVGVVLVFRDQTHERTIQKSLSESERRFRLLYENAPVAYQSLNQRAEILEVNNAWLEMMGYEKNEVIGRPIIHFIVQEDVPLLQERFTKFVETGEICGAEFNLKQKNGGVVTVSVDGRVGYSVDGKFRQIHCVLHNITERRKNEEAIKRKSEGISALLKISLNMLESLDKKTVFQNIVNNGVELLKLDSGAIYTLKENTLILEATNPFLPNDFPNEFRIASLFNHPHILKAINSKNIVTIEDTGNASLSKEEEIVVKTRQFGSLIYLPLIVEKRPLGVLILGTRLRAHTYSDDEINLCQTLSNLAALTLENATLFENINMNLAELEIVLDEKKKIEHELRISEERFRNLSENANDLIYRYEFYPKRGFTYVSPSSTKIIGYTPEEHYADPDLGLKLVHPDDFERVKRVMETEDSFDKPLVVRWFRKDGKIIWTEQKNVPIRDDNGKIIAIEGIARDITEQKNAEIIQQIQYNIADGIVKSETITEFLELVRNELSKFIDTNNFYVAFYDETSGMLHSDIEKDEMDTIDTWPAEKSLTGLVVKTKKSLLLSRQEIMDMYENGQIELIGTVPEVWLGAPLITNEKTFGAIVIQHYHNKNVYDLAGLEFLELIASQISFYIEKKKSEEDLKASEELFRTLANTTSTAIFVYQGTKFVYSNKAAQKISGYSEEEFLSKSFWDFIHPDFQEMVRERGLARLRGENIPEHYEFKIICKDGSEKWLDFTAGVITWQGKKAAIGTAFDITPRKLYEESLRRSELKLRSIFAAIPDIFLILDKDGKYIEIAPSQEHLLYLPKEQLLGRKVSEIFDKEMADRFLNLIRSTLETKSLQRLDYQLIINGKPIWFQATTVPYAKDQVVYIATDITKRKELENALSESEEKHRLISNLTSDYLFSTSIYDENEFELSWVSGSFEKITGYTLEEYKRVGGWRSLLHKDDLEIDRKAFETLLQNKPTSCEVRTYHKDGRIVWVRSYGYPIWDKNKNKLIGIIGAVSDITENKKMLEELIAAKDKAEKSDKLKSEFLAQMSHEIRSPLNIILNFISLIKEDVKEKIDEDLITGFASIDSAGRRIIRTIDLILNMSELQLGTYEILNREFDIIEILRRISLEYQPTATVKGLKLTFISEIRKLKLYTDEYATTQIVSNLVDNAIKYTKQGSVEIIAKKKNEKLIISIRDTGIGISEEFLPTLFSPFTQEEHGYTRSYEGNGLGLALVKKYCDLIGAQIEVFSKKGVGTTFTLTFLLNKKGE